MIRRLAVVSLLFGLCHLSTAFDIRRRNELRLKAKEMFMHGYDSYMTYAWPADELMPLSCRGRHRYAEPSRGDIDDALGDYQLTLVDSLDTLAVVGEYEEFETACKLVVHSVTFDKDIVVSVFEANIRVVGGLLSAHILARLLKTVLPDSSSFDWYDEQMLMQAKDLATRLLPAFNTTTGLPYPRVNLRYGLTEALAKHQDNCVACGGTMMLEFATLSRLTGESVFEEVARRAMDFLWEQRHRASDLMGNVLNIHNGDWVRRDSGIGAGIDSYYEYVFKSYVLLGEETYLVRFNKHYAAVMEYVKKGPLMLSVQMHKPNSQSQSWMDALLAFWPGLQVLKGDIQPAIELHEMLYQVVKRHDFLPEAFTSDFNVHWAHHPLRPEFIESTYFLYKATKDEHYLDVGEQVLTSLNKYARTKCGFAAVKDVRRHTQDDQMDSFVLAETFKYLYLLFADEGDLLFDPDNFVFTTEAHFLPLNLPNSNIANPPIAQSSLRRASQQLTASFDQQHHTGLYRNDDDEYTCKNLHEFSKNNMPAFITSIRRSVVEMVGRSGGGAKPAKKRLSPHNNNNNQDIASGITQFLTSPIQTLSHASDALFGHILEFVGLQQSYTNTHRVQPDVMAKDFDIRRKDHVELIGRMGINLVTMSDGKVQLMHNAQNAESPAMASMGMTFMTDMLALARQSHDVIATTFPRSVQILSSPHLGSSTLVGSAAQFGFAFNENINSLGIFGHVVMAQPWNACSKLLNPSSIRNKIVIAQRGDCMFVEKARMVEQAGGIGLVVVDNQKNSSAERSSPFAMSGDGSDDVEIPAVFLFYKQAIELLKMFKQNRNLVIRIGLLVKHILRAPGLFFAHVLNDDNFDSFLHVCDTSTSSSSTITNSDDEITRVGTTDDNDVTEMFIDSELGYACVRNDQTVTCQQMSHDTGATVDNSEFTFQLPSESGGVISSEMMREILWQRVDSLGQDQESKSIINFDFDQYNCVMRASDVQCDFNEESRYFGHFDSVFSFKLNVESGISSETTKDFIAVRASAHFNSLMTNIDERKASLIDWVVLPDGSKQIRFHFDLFTFNENDSVERIAQEVLKQLYFETNLSELPRAVDYSRALKKLVYLSRNRATFLDKSDETLLTDLADLLRTRDGFLLPSRVTSYEVRYDDVIDGAMDMQDEGHCSRPTFRQLIDVFLEYKWLKRTRS